MRYYKTEFNILNDELIDINALDEDMQAKIARKFMNELTQRLQRKDIRLQVSDEVYRLIATQGVDPVFGARPLVLRGYRLTLRKEDAHNIEVEKR